MKLLYVLLPFSIIIACNTSKDATIKPKSGEETLENQKDIQSSEKFKIILQEAHGGLKSGEQRVITNAKELANVYSIINRFRKPGLSMPHINFNESIVIALFMGEKRTGGFSTEIQSVSIEGDEMIVKTIEKGPNPTDYVATVICQPFCLVELPKPKEQKLVVFEKTIE